MSAASAATLGCSGGGAHARLSQRISASGALACQQNKSERDARIRAEKQAWEKELDGWTNERDQWSLDVAKGATHMHPRQMLRELEKAMPKHAMVSTDIGNICSVANSYLRFERARSMFAAMSFGNCGYAFPTMIGCKVAAPDRPAVAFVGDGAWGISFNELLTCVRENIGVTVVLFNNGQWGAEKKNHVDFYSNRYVGVNLDNPSFAGIARAFGCAGATVDKLADVVRHFIGVPAQWQAKSTVPRWYAGASDACRDSTVGAECSIWTVRCVQRLIPEAFLCAGCRP